MGDVHDGDALRRERADHAEEVLHLAGVEHGGRLVHDDDARVVGQRPRHGHDLLARGGEAADLVVGRDLGVAEPRQQLTGAGGGLAPLGEAAAVELVAEEHVLGDGQPVDDVQLLVDGRDAAVQGRDRVRDDDLLAVQHDLARGGLVRPREDLDEGGLARAVLAEQAVHLAGQHVEVHPVERLGAREVLDDALHAQQGGGGVAALRRCRVVAVHVDHASEPRPHFCRSSSKRRVLFDRD